jgi:hypothetical protein
MLLLIERAWELLGVLGCNVWWERVDSCDSIADWPSRGHLHSLEGLDVMRVKCRIPEEYLDDVAKAKNIIAKGKK